MHKIFDIQGIEVKVGDGVFYTKYERDATLHFGIVQRITEKGVAHIESVNRVTGRRGRFNARVSHQTAPERIIRERRVEE